MRLLFKLTLKFGYIYMEIWDRLQISLLTLCELTHFRPMSQFCTPWKRHISLIIAGECKLINSLNIGNKTCRRSFIKKNKFLNLIRIRALKALRLQKFFFWNVVSLDWPLDLDVYVRFASYSQKIVGMLCSTRYDGIACIIAVIMISKWNWING